MKGAVNYNVINGKMVVKDGRLTGIDEEKAPPVMLCIPVKPQADRDTL